MDYTIRPYTNDDYDFVWGLHIKENKSYIDRHVKIDMETARDWFNQNIAKQTGFIVEQHGVRIGCYFLYETEEIIKISRFFLIDEMQKKGIGSKLLSDLLKSIAGLKKSIQITVWVDNPVQKFWIGKGFVPVSVDLDNLTTLIYKGETV